MKIPSAVYAALKDGTPQFMSSAEAGAATGKGKGGGEAGKGGQENAAALALEQLYRGHLARDILSIDTDDAWALAQKLITVASS